ncbi:hypothetical protein [Pelagibacterium sp. H642]|uniref:hypothetical protein n=1 Tax=Pelagibacterium sp. H642 TaxID=1881069 RepID=UPI002815B00E|nr:hypothetical protein [Pelagibacterium sp. H642]WMT92801.1 hypothetical protein NO934_18645 [Pelagibacterium sp. H642]
MLQWISDNSEVLNLVANWAMVLIWIVYLQVFLLSFRRQTLPKIVINRAAGSTLDAACFVSNMSSDAIYIESVLVEIGAGDDTLGCTITDFEFFDGEKGSDDPKLRTYQGTLGPSQYTSLGKFEDLIASVARRTGHDVENLKSAGGPITVEITIIADYASEDQLIGARRKFRATWEGDHWKLIAETTETQQIRSPRERKRISELIAADE